VPFLVLPPNATPVHLRQEREAGLANIANTVLDLMGLKRDPQFYPSLLEKL